MKYSNKSGVKFRYYQNITKRKQVKETWDSKITITHYYGRKKYPKFGQKSKLDAIQSNMGQAGADIGGHPPPPKKRLLKNSSNSSKKKNP